nr:gamma-glutamyl-gamma-aminobutyrate hydrolase family protein [uncultured Acetatifactor sp.]
MKIFIAGRKSDTVNYERYIEKFSALPVTALSLGEMSSCDALILPGGGDITPAFFGENNQGSHGIDTELDIIQFQALDYALRRNIPVLGICKGMQVINVAFGGTIIQDLPTASIHRFQGQDQYHSTVILENSCLYELYGKKALVNSAHHQGLGKLGAGLNVIQWCPEDGCIEAIVHDTPPVLGLQWHPERLDNTKTTLSGTPLLTLLSSWICASRVPSLKNGAH